MKKRLLIGLLVSSVVFASAYGVAASLGILTADNLGATGQSVATCDNGVTASWTPTYEDALPGYAVGTLTIGGLHADCTGSDLSVQLTGASNAALAGGAAGPVTIDATTEPFTFSTVKAGDVQGVFVVIDGNGVDVTNATAP